MEIQNYRYAAEADVGLILQFIRELADYEKMLPEVVATECASTVCAVWKSVPSTAAPCRTRS